VLLVALLCDPFCNIRKPDVANYVALQATHVERRSQGKASGFETNCWSERKRPKAPATFKAAKSSQSLLASWHCPTVSHKLSNHGLNNIFVHVVPFKEASLHQK
jgi:hypothetical protein